MKPDRAGQAWLDALPDPTIAIDDDGRLEWGNQAAIDMFGWRLTDFVGRSVFDLIHPDDLHFALMSLESVQSKSVGSLIEVRVETAFGWKLVECIGANRLGQRGVDTIIITLRDLTARRRWEVAQSDDAIFRAVVHNAASLLMLVRSDGVIQSISGAVTRLLGRDPEHMEGMALLDLICPEDRRNFNLAVQESQAVPAGEQEPVTVEAGLLDGDGRVIPFELTLVDMATDPTVDGIVVSAHNITKLRSFQRALADLARKDPLTLLPNRTAVDDRLEAILARRTSVAVAFVDLNGFKALNDRHGHHFGDLVLRSVAERLVTTVRTSDLVARYGGDEFVVIADDLDEGVRIDRRLMAAMAEPMIVGDREIVVEASVGVTYTKPGDTVTSVLIRADQAMYGIKPSRHLHRAAG
ncbi:MAG TPA: diguanylate cyclase [Acidimicrobiales bacterium]|nr:diguanylate cyclase [Acidimicrobiales bacterium]